MNKMTHMSMVRTVINPNSNEPIISEIIAELPEYLTFLEKDMDEDELQGFVDKLMDYCSEAHDFWIPMAFMTQNEAQEALNFK
tara:strand:+ start:322 stop:570 length:249 start_codon:yes stop_codon:yes gene_type:complete